jgi:hypothetical protein
MRPLRISDPNGEGPAVAPLMRDDMTDIDRSEPVSPSIGAE